MKDILFDEVKINSGEPEVDTSGLFGGLLCVGFVCGGGAGGAACGGGCVGAACIGDSAGAACGILC